MVRLVKCQNRGQTENSPPRVTQDLYEIYNEMYNEMYNETNTEVCSCIMDNICYRPRGGGVHQGHSLCQTLLRNGQTCQLPLDVHPGLQMYLYEMYIY